MRRLAPLACLALIAAAALTADAAEDPPGTKFIGPVNPEDFSFPSTRGWDVDGPGKEKVVLTAKEADPNGTTAFDRQGLYWLWARKCLAGKQTVHFERDVYLAGPENKLAAHVDLLSSQGSTFKSVEMLVNGRQVLKVRGNGGGFDLTSDRAKVFRFGQNHLEVVAVKKASALDRRCNPPSPTRRRVAGTVTGVAFTVSGELAGDVTLPPQKTEEYYVRRGGEDPSLGSQTAEFDFEVRNNGPGGIARVPLEVRIDVPTTGEPHGTILVISDPQPPVLGCKATPAAGTDLHPEEGYAPDGPRTVQCTIANLRAGAPARQHMRLIFNPHNESGSRTPVYVNWSAYVQEPDGADATDNKRFKTLVICQPDAGCPTS
jgi:hypothetical protein